VEQESTVAGRFDGKVALVVGSSESIGLRVAQRLAREGATVVLNGRDRDRGETALAELRSDGFTAHFQQGDASRHEDMAGVVERVERDVGPIELLANIGGSARPGPTPFLDLQPADMQRALEGRILPRLFATQAVALRMKERRRGAIVLVASDAARHPTPGESLIGAAGAAVMLLTKALGREFARWGIRVNCMALTITADTPRYDKVFAQPGFSNTLFSKALERFPAGRAPTASEVADVAAFLLSADAAQITGQTLSVNGGLSFGGW
jgi:2-hydroxycyclohexanecarboxyl-CoA dehydrogenase